MLKQRVLAATVASFGLIASFAFAEEAKEEPKSPHSVTGNLTFTTNYVVRGLTQTNSKPAVQGTIEYGHASGFYAGLFGSNVTWPGDAWEPAAPGVNSAIYGGTTTPPTNAISAGIELDLYAGFRNKFAGDFSYDVGAIYYYYPGTFDLNTSPAGNPGLMKPNTGEVYGALGWKWLTAKLSYAVSDGVFMIGDARGSYYGELNAAYPLGETGVTLVGHVGTWKWNGEMEYYKNLGLKNDIFNAVDYKLGATYDALGFTWGAFYWGSNADETTAIPAGGTTAVWGNRFGKNVGRDTFFLTLTKAF
jgi:uncharacterized protein (TIGR02001 family)